MYGKIKQLSHVGSNCGPHQSAQYNNVYSRTAKELFDGDATINEKRTISLHWVQAKRHEERLKACGIRMKPLERNEVEKIALAPLWQNNPVSEKEMGGMFFPETKAEVEQYYKEREIDPEDVYKANEKIWKARMLATGRRTELEEGFRTAFNNATNTDAIGTNYNHQAQFELRIAGQLMGEFGNQVDIPNGYAAQMFPKLGIGQFLKTGPVTTESYSVNQPVTPGTSSITITPQKIMSVTFWTGEFSEDSLWEVAPTMDTANQLGLRVALDHMILNGDPNADTTNINSLGITALGALDPRLCFAGLRRQNYDGTLGGGAAGAFKGHNALGQPWTLNGVAALLGSMGKYGVDPTKVITILPASVRAQLMQDAKARPDTYQLLVQMLQGMMYSVCGSRLITLGDSVITNLSSGGVPNYASWTSEGVPINLAATGCYTGAGTYKTAVACYTPNWIFGWKRHYQQVVIALPMSDQFATAASVRVQGQPLFTGVGEAVAYNIN